MTRGTLIKKLKALGDIPVPEGHARTNKGVTTYFFAHSQVEEVYRFCAESIRNQRDADPRTPTAGQLGFLADVVPNHVPVTLHLRTRCPANRNHGSLFVHIQNRFVSVAILDWPA